MVGIVKYKRTGGEAYVEKIHISEKIVTGVCKVGFHAILQIKLSVQ